MKTYIKFANRNLEVTGMYVPATMGYRENGGVQIDPDEPETFDIESIKENGSEIELDEDDHFRLIDEILRQLQDRCY